MFTGIVQSQGIIQKIKKSKTHQTFDIDIEDPKDLIEGASISVQGVCLTVTNINQKTISFDLIPETLSKTTLNNSKPGDIVNIERSAKIGDEIGGHLVSGHIDGTAQISNITNNSIFELKVDTQWIDYILHKGFIAINGVSLTVVNPSPEGFFEVHLIPETLDRTTFRNTHVGDFANIELENQTKAIVQTVKKYLSSKN